MNFILTLLSYKVIILKRKKKSHPSSTCSSYQRNLRHMNTFREEPCSWQKSVGHWHSSKLLKASSSGLGFPSPQNQCLKGQFACPVWNQIGRKPRVPHILNFVETFAVTGKIRQIRNLTGMGYVVDHTFGEGGIINTITTGHMKCPMGLNIPSF